MTRQTGTKIARRYGLFREPDGKPVARLLEVIHPPEKRKNKILRCGIMEFSIFVSEGQIINERKMCKKLLKTHRNYLWKK